jgi:hypothetical protein
MKVIKALALILVCAGLSAQSPKGTVPRASADKYPAHAEQSKASIGALLLSRKEARKIFITNVEECCIVVEVALFPKGAHVNVSVDDFVLRVKGADIGVRPSSAELIAADLLETVPTDRTTQTGIETHSGVGYEHGGYDPVTGQRRPSGVVYSSGAGVGVGVGGKTEPSNTETIRYDRRAMEQELSGKALPMGEASAPVSGYLYFPVPAKDRKNARQLEYTTNGEKIVLNLQ